MRYAPLYIREVSVSERVRDKEDEQFLRAHPSYAELTSVGDRLRWCRLQRWLRQKDVEAETGIPHYYYMQLENDQVDVMKPEVSAKLSAFYEIPEEDLVDKYNRFLREGQCEGTRAVREKRGLSKRAFAAEIGADRGSVRAWESGKKLLSRAAWEAYYQEKKE